MLAILVLAILAGANSALEHVKNLEISPETYKNVAGLCDVSEKEVQDSLSLLFSKYNPDIQIVASNGMSGEVLLGVLSVIYQNEIFNEKYSNSFFENLINSPKYTTPEYYKILQSRFFDLFQSKAGEIIPPHVQTFASTQWAETHAPSIFDEYPNIIMQRVQIGNNCFIQGPFVDVHYLVSMSTGTCADSLDIRKYVLFSFRGPMFTDYLEGRGGDSYDLLDELVRNYTSIEKLSEHEVLGGWITDRFLKERGPILISRFVFFDQFCKDEKYRIAPDKEFKYTKAMPIEYSKNISTHTMLLIGVNKTETGETVYLIQNWYPHAQFIQMSAEFLISRKSVFYYVESYKSLKQIPNKFKVPYVRYDEAIGSGRDGVTHEI